MNKNSEEHGRLLFRHEALRARLDVRDFFLKNTVREVYENIGQVLSLVRLQLAMLDTNKKAVTATEESPGHLVGRSIRDLRVMCKSFYPDADILNEEGFLEAFENTIKILYQHDKPVIRLKGIHKEIQPELRLIVFKMLQEIMILIQEAAGKFMSLNIAYLEQKVKFTIVYSGTAITFDNKTGNGSDLSLQERAHLIEGRLSSTTHKNGLFQIQLCHSFKYLYE